MFSSGLRVRFSDQVDYADDHKSVCSEQLRPTRWDNEMSRIFGQRHNRNMRECLTSPTPSLVSDRTIKDSITRVTGNSGSVHSVYSNVSGSVRSEDHEHCDDVTKHLSQTDTDHYDVGVEPVDTSYANDQLYNGCHSNHDADQSDFQRDFQYHMYMSEPLDHWRLDSPPDSAIDIDTSSVQSALSLDLLHRQSANQVPCDIMYSQNSAIQDADRRHCDRPVPQYHDARHLQYEDQYVGVHGDHDDGVTGFHSSDSTALNSSFHKGGPYFFYIAVTIHVISDIPIQLVISLINYGIYYFKSDSQIRQKF